MHDKAEVVYKVLPVALEDAAHLYLAEGEVAQIIRLLMRDPTTGEDTGKGRLKMGWHQFDVIYDVHLSEDRITVYIFRIRETARKPGFVAQAGPRVRKLVEKVIEAKLVALLRGGL